MPCFEPVMTMLDGDDAELCEVTRGSNELRPWMMPKRFTERILWK